MPASVAVVLVNLGSPAAPTAAATRRYLAQFLADPRVVEIPAIAWRPILHGIILRTRPRQSAAKYASIWTDAGSPLVATTAELATRVQEALGDAVTVRSAMRYGEPALARTLDALVAAGHRRILALPLYPQYAASTTASVCDELARWVRRTRAVPELRWVARYWDEPGYVQALAARVRAHWDRHGRGQAPDGGPAPLVMSFHGIPARSRELGDPYADECERTARALARTLQLADGQWQLTFQSRFGKARWLEPYTQPTIEALASAGHRRVDVICPGFAVDCLETLEEIGMEVRHAFEAAGGTQFHYLPCLNAEPDGVQLIRDVALRHLGGWIDGGVTTA